MTVPDIIDTPAEGFPLPTVDDRSERRKVLDVLTRLTPGAKARAMQRTQEITAVGDALRDGLKEGLTVVGPDPEVNTFVQGIVNKPGVAERITDLFDRLDGEVAAAVGVPRDALVGQPGPTHDARLDEPVRMGIISRATADLFDREIGAGRRHDAVVEAIEAAQAWAPNVYENPAHVPVFDGEIARRLERHDQPGPLAQLTANFKRLHDTDLTNAFDAGRAYERGATLRRNVGAKSLGSRRVQAQGIAADYLRDDPERGALHAAMVLAGFLGQDPATVTP